MCFKNKAKLFLQKLFNSSFFKVGPVSGASIHLTTFLQWFGSAKNQGDIYVMEAAYCLSSLYYLLFFANHVFPCDQVLFFCPWMCQLCTLCARSTRKNEKISIYMSHSLKKGNLRLPKLRRTLYLKYLIYIYVLFHED